MLVAEDDPSVYPFWVSEATLYILCHPEASCRNIDGLLITKQTKPAR